MGIGDWGLGIGPNPQIYHKFSLFKFYQNKKLFILNDFLIMVIFSKYEINKINNKFILYNILYHGNSHFF